MAHEEVNVFNWILLFIIYQIIKISNLFISINECSGYFEKKKMLLYSGQSQIVCFFLQNRAIIEMNKKKKEKKKKSVNLMNYLLVVRIKHEHFLYKYFCQNSKSKKFCIFQSPIKYLFKLNHPQ